MLGDIAAFLLRRPPQPTLMQFSSRKEQQGYSRLIMQRIGVYIGEYSVLNIHKIGIEAPIHHVFEELLNWNGDSSCWPNHIANVERVDDAIEKIRIHLLGLQDHPLLRWTNWSDAPLFDLNLLHMQRTPGPSDPDNARYLLYSCEGGYPIGVFVIYVRSSIESRGETEMSQVFMAVGFDFYGKRRWSLFGPVHRIWEAIHNQVTANVLNRFKQLCEWRFERLQAGL